MKKMPVLRRASPVLDIVCNNDCSTARVLGLLLGANVIFLRVQSAGLDMLHGSRREEALRLWIVDHYPEFSSELNSPQWADVMSCLQAAISDSGAAVLLSSRYGTPLACLIESQAMPHDDCSPHTVAHRRLTALAHVLNGTDMVFMRNITDFGQTVINSAFLNNRIVPFSQAV